MGKYMKKAKAVGGEVAVMEVPHQTSLGVRTRARTLALQQRRPIAAASLPENTTTSSSYLQLRSRRLEKPAIYKPKEQSCNATSPRSGRSSSSRAPEPVHSGSVVGSVSVCCSRREETTFSAAAASDGSPEIEVSFGENVDHVETRGRNTRETTPCSLMRDSENIGTPGSTTRPSNSTNRRIQNSVRRDIPTTQEIEDLFSEAEQLQQKKFIEKYNFDPVNEQPLPGRYEWVKSDE